MASGHVGTLRARLGLNAKPFNRGLAGAQSRTRAFASAVSRNIALVGAAMAAAATAGVVALTRNAMRFIDTQAKVARTIDGSIDALRALQIAAGDAGVAQSDLNKSMQMIGARLVEAKVKGGATADALDRLGLSADSLLDLDADARLAAIADRINELGLSSSQTTQFLMDMGVRSKEMALLLVDGGGAIRAARQEVDALGLSMSAVDAAKVEQANDAMSRIKLVTEGVGNRLAVAFAPALQAIAEGFTNSMREGGLFRTMIESTGAVVSGFLTQLGNVITILGAVGSAIRTAIAESAAFQIWIGFAQKVWGWLNAIRVGISNTVAFFANLIEITGGFGEAMGALAPIAVEVWQRIGDGADYVRASVAVMTARMSELFLASLAKMVNGWVTLTNSVAEGMNSLFGTNLSGADEMLAAPLFRAATSARHYGNAALDAMNKAGASFKAPLSSLAALREKVKSATTSATKDLDETSDAAANTSEALNELGTAGGGAGGGGSAGAASKIDQVKTATERLNEHLKQTRDVAKTAFSDIVLGAKSVSDAIGEALKKFAAMGVDRVFNALWSKGIGALASGGGGGGFLGGLLGGIFGKSLPSFDGGGNTGFAARTGGLDGKGGFLAMLHPQETVIDHSRASAGQTQGGVTELRVISDPGVIVEISRNEANIVVSQAGPGIARAAQQLTFQRMAQTKRRP